MNRRNRLIELVEYAILIAVPVTIFLSFSTDGEVVHAESEVSDTVVHVKDKTVVFEDGVFPLIEKVISQAEKSIYVSTYTIRQNRVMKLLEKKSSEGLKIHIAYGKSKDGYVPLFSNGPVKKKYGIFHSKFIVTDSENVLITSGNLGSDSRAVNNAVFFKDVPKTAKILEKEVADASSGKLPRRCEKGCDTEIGRVFFTPGKACVNIKKEFLKAEKSIDGAVYTVTTKNPVITGLKNVLKKKSAPVRLIFDNWKGESGRVVNKRAGDYFSSFGADVKYDNSIYKKDPLFHHKFAVIDKKVTVLGSLNWTSSGCYKNREIIVINSDENLSEKFSEYFTTIWN